MPLTSGPGFYKGNVVHIKKVDKKSVDLTRDIRKELIRVSLVLPSIHLDVECVLVCLLFACLWIWPDV